MPGTKNSGGRNKLSAKAHVLRGTFRGDRHAGDDTPEAPTGRPSPPVALEGHAKDEWERMVDRLAKAKTLSIVDDAALYQYCRLFAETEQLREDNDRLRVMSKELMALAQKLQGPDLVDVIGKVSTLEQQISRQSTKLRQGHMAIRGYLVEFGMTPSARTRVKMLGGGIETPKSRVDQFRQRKTTA